MSSKSENVSSKKAKLTKKNTAASKAAIRSWKNKPERTKSDHVKTVTDALEGLPTSLILAAVTKILKESKKAVDRELSLVLKYATSDITHPRKILAQLKVQKVNPLDPFQGLTLLIDANLSKRQYLRIREAASTSGRPIFPSYDSVREAKDECRPPLADATITETSASYTLESLVHYTTKRIIKMQKEAILESQTRRRIKSEQCVITFSCGCDGSSGQRNYKQKYADQDNATANDDSSIFATTLIPLRLQSTSEFVYWNNQTPQSIRYCRPLKIQFAKETKQLILSEKQSLEDQIKKLEITPFDLGNGHSIDVKFEFYMSIIDGKVLSVFTDTKSSQSCPVCQATPNDFNIKENLGSQKFRPKEGSLKYGISPLHCYIRAMEWMLHVAYKLPIAKWQARSQEEKDIVKSRKTDIQSSLWKQMGLRVDFPNSSGSGSSNDGNTARRAFQNYEQFGHILGIKIEILEMLRNILLTLNSQLPINPEKFQMYSNKLFLTYLKDYGWYKLPSSIHKVLVHGCEIISASTLPLGMLGEEGAEARNKVYKSDRALHARKNSRYNTMFDVFFRAIDSSDPILSSQSLTVRINSKSKKETLPFDVIQLLEVPTIMYSNVSENDENGGTDSVDPCVACVLDDIVLENENDDVA